MLAEIDPILQNAYTVLGMLAILAAGAWTLLQRRRRASDAIRQDLEILEKLSGQTWADQREAIEAHAKREIARVYQIRKPRAWGLHTVGMLMGVPQTAFGVLWVWTGYVAMSEGRLGTGIVVLVASGAAMGMGLWMIFDSLRDLISGK